MVAAVSGAAVGIGTTMLLHCDQVIASESAVLLTPFVSLGLLPEAGSSLVAPRLMGHARAFSLLVMG
ncbi:MAG: enoyl-CoA hydratase-related protein, partial [Pseudolabrys sp.]